MANATDPHRRLALQLAIQLPADVEEARAVLTMTREVLEEFMIEQRKSARGRARALGWQLDLLPAPTSLPTLPTLPTRTSPWAAALWALASLLITLPLGALLVERFGAGAGISFLVGETVVALVLGTWPALLLAVVTPLLHNYLLIPPLMELDAPHASECIMFLGYLITAFAVPWIARRRRSIRAALPLLPREEVTELTTRAAAAG